MILIPSPEDKELLAQLPALVRTHNANGAKATGVPEVLEEHEAEIVDGWIANLLLRDPEQLMVFAVDDGRLTGAMVVQHRQGNAEMLTMNSPNLASLHRMRDVVVRWAHAVGARCVIGTTFRSPRAMGRALGTVHVRDLLIREV